MIIYPYNRIDYEGTLEEYFNTPFSTVQLDLSVWSRPYLNNSYVHTFIGPQIPYLNEKLTSNIENLILPNCTTILNCGNLKIKYFDGINVTLVDRDGFYGCTKLERVNLPQCNKISHWGFYGCYNLKDVYAPNCVTISQSSFQGCNSLKSIDFPACQEVAAYAFQSLPNLTTINLPSCSDIYGYAFADCSKLTEVNIPKAKFLYDRVFSGCINLTTLRAPNCSKIQSRALFGCEKLSQLYLDRSDTICTLDATALRATQITSSTGSIYVPSTLLSDYKNAYSWQLYSARIFPIPSV